MRAQGFLDTCGETVALASEIDWVTGLMLDGSDGAFSAAAPRAATMSINVQATSEGFGIAHLRPLARQAWSGADEIVVVDVCGTGFDVRLSLAKGSPEFTARWRPSPDRSLARRMLPRRFQLLAREALLHYPVLWWASVRGRAPLHAIACTVGHEVLLLAGPGGVGKSTLLQLELANGGTATSDNVCVGDGTDVWGLVEPMRVADGRGPRTTHGRVEVPMIRRASRLAPDQVVVVRRGDGDQAAVHPVGAEDAARSLVTGTYAAGELSRFWGYAATLAAGSGIGPSHPAVEEVARSFASRLSCRELRLPRRPGTRLSEVLDRVEAIA